MKPNCKDCGKVSCAWNGADIEKQNSNCFVCKLFNISSPDLIAELEKRRPCEKCSAYTFDLNLQCPGCIWRVVNEKRDNFKEAK